MSWPGVAANCSHPSAVITTRIPAATASGFRVASAGHQAANHDAAAASGVLRSTPRPGGAVVPR